MDISYMKSSAANRIVDSSKFTGYYSLTAVQCGIFVPASMYRNLRDAMVHYKVMIDCIDADDYDRAQKNYNNLFEHLIRGEKDAVISYIQSILGKINNVTSGESYEYYVDIEHKRKVREIIHELKNILIEIRLLGLKLDPNNSKKPAFFLQKAMEFVIKLQEIFDIYGLNLF